MTEKTDPIAQMRARLDEKAAKVAAEGSEPTEQEIAAKKEVMPVPEPPAEPVELYQQYTSSRVAICFFTPTGKRINFTNYEYYTQDEEIIAYLDGQLKNKRKKSFKKGIQVTQDELNPAAALRRKTIEEFKLSQEGRDFSEQGALARAAAAGKSGGAGTGMVNTGDVPVG